MMRHNIADALTFFRFPAAILLFVFILTEHWLAATILFTAAILSDALDGIVARKWKPRPRWYNKDSHVFDNAGDLLLFSMAMLGLTIKIFPIWLIVLIVSAIGTGIFLFFIAKMRPSIAEKIDVVFGWCFGALLFVMLVQITAKAMTGEAFTVAIFVYAAATLVIVVKKWDRVTSRREVTYTGTW